MQFSSIAVEKSKIVGGDSLILDARNHELLAKHTMGSRTGSRLGGQVAHNKSSHKKNISSVNNSTSLASNQMSTGPLSNMLDYYIVNPPGKSSVMQKQHKIGMATGFVQIPELSKLNKNKQSLGSDNQY